MELTEIINYQGVYTFNGNKSVKLLHISSCSRGIKVCMTYFSGVHTKTPFQAAEKYDHNIVSSAVTHSDARTK